MSNIKIKRIKDPKLLNSYRFKSCLACGCSYGVVAHHISTKKSGGHDIDINLMPLCVQCHADIHNCGLTEFCFRNVHVQFYLQDRGWDFSDYQNKWVNPQSKIN